MVVCYRHTQLAYLETAELNNNDNNNINNNVMDPKTAGGKSSPPVDVTSFISDNLLPLSLDSWVGDAVFCSSLKTRVGCHPAIEHMITILT